MNDTATSTQRENWPSGTGATPKPLRTMDWSSQQLGPCLSWSPTQTRAITDICINQVSRMDRTTRHSATMTA